MFICFYLLYLNEQEMITAALKSSLPRGPSRSRSSSCMGTVRAWYLHRLGLSREVPLLPRGRSPASGGAQGP